jgi:hypothetical protein
MTGSETREKVEMKRVNYAKLAAVLFLMGMNFCASSDNNKGGNGHPEAEYRLLKLHYDNTSGENGLTTFAYDQEGCIDKAVWELTDGSRNSLNFYNCDEDANLVRKYREFSDGITSTQTYEYDESGNLTVEHFERSDGVSGVTDYEYDDNGLLIKAVCKGLNGWFFGDIYYTYDEAGNMIKGDIFQKGENSGVIDYSYDDNNNLVREHWDFLGEWSQTFNYEYETCDIESPKTYTSSNVFINSGGDFRIIGEYYDFSKETGGPSHYVYDREVKLVNKTFERSDGLTTSTFYLYDCRGNLTKSYRKYSNGLRAIFSYEFDEDRKLVGRSFKRIDGIGGSESYQYDETSRLITAYYENFDSWLTGTITFTYGENGRVEEGYFKAGDDYDADITFGYDEEGNLSRIHWEFSFDKTQTYTFEYEKISGISNR